MRSDAILGAALLGLAGCVIGDSGDTSSARYEAGAAVARDFEPGRVIHDVCVAVDVPGGYLRPVALVDDGAIGPGDGAPIEPSPPSELNCPDDPEWQGWARLEWRSATGRARVTVERTAAPGPTTGQGVDGLSEEDPQGASLIPTASASGGDLMLSGQRFGGYDVTVEDITTEGASILVPLSVAYRDAGPLPGRAADGVDLALAFVPAVEGAFIGSSSGEAFTTDVDGHIYVFVDPSRLDCSLAESYALFVTPRGGGTVLAASLPCGF